MSRTHTVKRGELLYLLSQRYYGVTNKWRLIVNANPQLKGRGSASDGSPIIYPGDVLVIPDDTEKTKREQTTINADENELSIVVDGQQIRYFPEFTVNQPIDSFDTFSLPGIPFNVDSELYREVFRPFSYKEVKLFYGNNIYFTGVLLAPQSQSSPDSKTVSLSGYAKCARINDFPLSISKYPIEFNNQDLQQIANQMISDYGISAIFDAGPGNPFKKVSPEINESIMGFIIDLAQQRGLLTTNNELGNLRFWEESTGLPVASFKEGETPFISCVPTFNPQNFYSHITGVIPAKSGVASEKYTVNNNYLINKGITSPYNYEVKDIEKGDLQKSVMSKAGRMFAESCGYRLTLQGHKDRNGNLYQKNTIISVNAPGAFIYNDFNFLIKNVSISRSASGGDLTVLDLCIPGSYSGKIPTKFPWEE